MQVDFPVLQNDSLFHDTEMLSLKNNQIKHKFQIVFDLYISPFTHSNNHTNLSIINIIS